MLPLAKNIFAFPIVHGSAPSTLALRKHLMEVEYRSLLIPFPPQIREACFDLVRELPSIHSLVFEDGNELAYLPADPCDAFIEALRQGLQGRNVEFVGPNHLPHSRNAVGIPDPWILEGLDIREWTLAHWPFLVARAKQSNHSSTFSHIAAKSLQISETSSARQLLICHITDLPGLYQAFSGTPELISEDTSKPMRMNLWPIKAQQLYFALGEMPYFAGFFEQNRLDPFASLPSSADLAKQLLMRTRDLFEQSRKQQRVSPARLQSALRFVQRLADEDGQIMANLFDWVTASKATLGDDFAIKLLDLAKTYPYQDTEGPFLKLGPEKIQTPLMDEPAKARNLLRDLPMVFRTLKLRQDPKPESKEMWKHSWNPNRSCSHIPEDLKIEQFNQHVRKLTLKALQGSRSKSVPFTGSLLDGLDLRSTIRHWHTGQYWVHEVPPLRGKLDTIIVIFDEDHDEDYPHRCTWYAEHNEESTLSFYSTDPMQDMIGPGIARARYGGLSLIFPPRQTPDLFEIPHLEGLGLAGHLAYASMLYSQERLVGYISEKRPSLKLREIARRLGKHLVWTPLHQFQRESIAKLRTFHILNGSEIRSIASRFIGY